MKEPNAPRPLQSFNLETMSGVFPGTRTRRHHLLQLSGANDSESSMEIDQDTNPKAAWAKIYWTEEPATAVAVDQSGQEVFQIEVTHVETIFGEIAHAFLLQNQQVVACGTCQHWERNLTVDEREEPSYGKCGKRSEIILESHPNPVPSDNSFADNLADELTLQSSMALSCLHWQVRMASSMSSKDGSETKQADNASPALNFGSAPKSDVDLSEVQVNRSWWVEKFRQWIGSNQAPEKKQSAQQMSKTAKRVSLKQLDRSGVGAGTEPCLGCHGRIANLGALVVQTTEGDRQTYSVWRCRNCAATYLNSWIDRWERLDNLETEETLYRVAPTEALQLLVRIHGIDGGDHPQERETRDDERDWFEAFRHDRSALSHQIRHGR